MVVASSPQSPFTETLDTAIASSQTSEAPALLPNAVTTTTTTTEIDTTLVAASSAAKGGTTTTRIPQSQPPPPPPAQRVYTHFDWYDDDDWVLGALKRKTSSTSSSKKGNDLVVVDDPPLHDGEGNLDTFTTTAAVGGAFTTTVTVDERPPMPLLQQQQQQESPNDDDEEFLFCSKKRKRGLSEESLQPPPPPIIIRPEQSPLLLQSKKKKKKPRQKETATADDNDEKMKTCRGQEFSSVEKESSTLASSFGDVHIPISEKVKLGRRKNHSMILDAPVSPTSQITTKKMMVDNVTKKEMQTVQVDCTSTSPMPISEKVKLERRRTSGPPSLDNNNNKKKLSMTAKAIAKIKDKERQKRALNDTLLISSPSSRTINTTKHKEKPLFERDSRMEEEYVKRKEHKLIGGKRRPPDHVDGNRTTTTTTTVRPFKKYKIAKEPTLKEEEETCDMAPDVVRPEKRKKKKKKKKEILKNVKEEVEEPDSVGCGDAEISHDRNVVVVDEATNNSFDVVATEKEKSRRKKEARTLTPSDVLAILGEDSPCADSANNWVRRSARMPSRAALMSPNTQVLLHKLCSNDDDMVVLKMKKYVSDPATPPVVIDAVLDALEENRNCESLYIQNYNEGMKDAQVLHLLEILKRPTCKIWCLNIGETYKVKRKTWKKFARGLKHTKVTHMYASEHTISPELKEYIRETIRENRTKHTMHIDVENLDTIVKCTHCWWNPINAKALRPYLKAKGYDSILHDKEAQGVRGTKSAEHELI